MTNGDYIRNVLADDVLAGHREILCEIAYSLLRNDPDKQQEWECAGCPLRKDDYCITTKDELLAEWLKAERKEEENNDKRA